MRTIVITGASDGIGRELALTMAKPGHAIVVAARSVDKLHALVGECEKKGAKAVAIATDVAEPAQVKNLIERAAETFGGIDVLVNNPGISMQARFEDVRDLSLFEKLMRVNFHGAVHCTFHALPHLKKSKGIVVAVSSLQGKTGFPTYSAYAATKHAMQGFFDSLRIELYADGVDVLVVSPGPVATEIHSRRIGADGKTPGSQKRAVRKGVMSSTECAQRIARAIDRREREVVMITKAALWLRLIAPKRLDKFVADGVAQFDAMEKS